MRARPPIPVLLVAALATGALGGCGKKREKPVATTPPDIQQLVSLNVDHDRIEFGRRVNVTGTVTRNQSTANDIVLHLYERPDTGKREAWRPVAMTTSGDDGEYRFAIRPDRNVELTVGTDPNAAHRSFVVPVAVSLRSTVRTVGRGGRRSLVYVARGPADAKPRQADALLYTARRGSKRYTRAGQAPLQPGERPGAVATATFTPAPKRSLSVLVCVPGGVAPGWGNPDSDSPPCGERAFRYSAPRP